MVHFDFDTQLTRKIQLSEDLVKFNIIEMFLFYGFCFNVYIHVFTINDGTEVTTMISYLILWGLIIQDMGISLNKTWLVDDYVGLYHPILVGDSHNPWEFRLTSQDQKGRHFGFCTLLILDSNVQMIQELPGVDSFH